MTICRQATCVDVACPHNCEYTAFTTAQIERSFLNMQHLPPRGDKAARLIQLFMYLHGKPADNAYARPLDFVPVVDLNRRKVLNFWHQRHNKA